MARLPLADCPSCCRGSAAKLQGLRKADGGGSAGKDEESHERYGRKKTLGLSGGARSGRVKQSFSRGTHQEASWWKPSASACGAQAGRPERAAAQNAEGGKRTSRHPDAELERRLKALAGRQGPRSRGRGSAAKPRKRSARKSASAAAPRPRPRNAKSASAKKRSRPRPKKTSAARPRKRHAASPAAARRRTAAAARRGRAAGPAPRGAGARSAPRAPQGRPRDRATAAVAEIGATMAAVPAS
jgi:translation initiation factor IF-2